MQDIVVGNKNFTDVTKPSEIVQLLLNEDQLASLNANGAATTTTEPSTKRTGKKSAATAQNDSGIRELWNEEGDDFFGHAASTQAGPSGNAENEDDSMPAPQGRGRKRKGDGTPATRGRKPGPKGGRKKASAVVDDADS